MTVSDEPPFSNAFLARAAGCSTMITVPTPARTGTRRYSAKNAAADRVVQPLWYDSGGEELQVPAHVVIPGHLHSLLARDHLDHRQRLGAGGAARLSLLMGTLYGSPSHGLGSISRYPP